MAEASLPLDTGPARVLVVEDEPKLSALLADYLRAAGHEPECVTDGRDVLPAWTARRHELILLDLMLPGLDGLSLCREIRARSSVPIVMLTARADETDRLLGLELGADDYIAKNPYSPREVMARVKAVLRRSRGGGGGGGGAHHPVPPADAGIALPLQIDDAGWRANWSGQALDLTPIEFRLLRTLATQPGRVYSRAQLLGQLHDDGRAVTERAVDSHVKNLRRKLQHAGAGECIRAIYGVGYRFDA
ncbi:MAG: response regulator [Roseateles sp.]|uniref:response regulator n=1 Tax=Roseateles sp. TaxID=1971397 RepID=UPI004036E2E4